VCGVLLDDHGNDHDTSNGIHAPALRLRAACTLLVESS
jgi:hypothetical protein